MTYPITIERKVTVNLSADDWEPRRVMSALIAQAFGLTGEEA